MSGFEFAVVAGAWTVGAAWVLAVIAIDKGVTLREVVDALDEIVRAAYNFLGLGAFYPPRPPKPTCADMFAATGGFCELEPGHVGVHQHDRNHWYGNVIFEELA